VQYRSLFHSSIVQQFNKKVKTKSPLSFFRIGKEVYTFTYRAKHCEQMRSTIPFSKKLRSTIPFFENNSVQQYHFRKNSVQQYHFRKMRFRKLGARSLQIVGGHPGTLGGHSGTLGGHSGTVGGHSGTLNRGSLWHTSGHVIFVCPPLLLTAFEQRSKKMSARCGVAAK